MMTGCPGVFAGGDMVPSERTVTVGVGHGKKAAGYIDAYLGERTPVVTAKHNIATFDALHLWYFGMPLAGSSPSLRQPSGLSTSTRWSAA
jgi:hypothetical protein